ncbi:MAG: hypothetical protein V4603_08565 [Pseudomonadota bacterium]
MPLPTSRSQAHKSFASSASHPRRSGPWTLLLAAFAACVATAPALAVEPPAGTATTLNNIGTFDSGTGLLTSCVRLQDAAGQPSADANGTPQIYDVVLSLKGPALVFKLTSFAPFNATAGKDCSGVFRNGVFSDKLLIKYPGWVMDGAVLNIAMDFITGSNLEFQLRTDANNFSKVRNFTGNSTGLGTELGDFKGNSSREFGTGAIPPTIKFKLPQCSDPQGDENKAVLEKDGTVIAAGTPGSEYLLSTSTLAVGEHLFKSYCTDEAVIRSISTAAGMTPDARNFGISSYATGTVKVKVPAGTTTTPTTGTLNFQIDSATTASDEQLIRQTAEFARDFMLTTFGRTLQKSTTIATSTTAQGCLNGGSSAFTGQQAMTICINNQGWKVHGAVNKQKILIHEIFHLLQFEMRWLGGGPATTGPHWIIEGSAEYVGWLGINTLGGATLDTARGCMLKEVTDYGLQQPPGLPNLSEFETQQSFSRPGPVYPLSMLGIDQLVTGTSVNALLNYGNALTTGIAAETAFESAFGTTRAGFYAQFPTYKAALPVPATYLCRI